MTPRPDARDLHVVPEPTPEEREAITLALAAADVLPPGYRSAWRRSGAPCSEQGAPPEAGSAGS